MKILELVQFTGAAIKNFAHACKTLGTRFCINWMALVTNNSASVFHKVELFWDRVVRRILAELDTG